MIGSCLSNAQAYANIATAISAPIAAVSLFIAVVTLLRTRDQHLKEIRNFNEALQFSYYADLDRMYFDLIAMRVGKPHLSGNPDHIKTVLHRQQYREYGFLVWNFLETVYDRCLDSRLDQARYKSLQDTWKPAFESEMTEHRRWFSDAEHKRFKEPFRDHIRDELAKLDRKE